jgi:release factor glutamine methyltransferase
MRLRFPAGVHSPLSDTRLLIAAMLELGVDGAGVADLCTGSGAVAIAAAENGAGRVLAVDVSRRAVLAARLNAALNRCSVEVRRGDMLSALGSERFDLIVANPPYVPAETDVLPRHSARTALDAGRDGRVLIDRICRHAAGCLRPGGSVLIVHSSVCGEDRTRALLAEHGLRASTLVRAAGPLGPVLRSRAEMLRERGLLGEEDEEEEIVVMRGLAPPDPAMAGDIPGRAGPKTRALA